MPRNRMLTLFAAIPLTLAACGTQQERCISRHTQEYRAISSLLAEVEGNLSRGYAWAERDVVRSRMTQCREVYKDKDGNLAAQYRPCWRDYVDTERYRVPIDPGAEERKRDGLKARQDVLSAEANAYAAACKKAYPEDT